MRIKPKWSKYFNIFKKITSTKRNKEEFLYNLGCEVLTNCITEPKCLKENNDKFYHIQNKTLV